MDVFFDGYIVQGRTAKEVNLESGDKNRCIARISRCIFFVH